MGGGGAWKRKRKVEVARQDSSLWSLLQVAYDRKKKKEKRKEKKGGGGGGGGGGERKRKA